MKNACLNCIKQVVTCGLAFSVLGYILIVSLGLYYYYCYCYLLL